MSNLIKKYLPIVALLLFGCGGNNADWSEFPAFQDAKDIKEYRFGNGGAREKYFIVEAAYPNMDVLQFYSIAIGAPWVACEHDPKWTSFSDATKKPPVFVHQTIRYWANFDADRLLMLAVKYESKGGKYRQMPDSKEQNVYLVEYKEGILGEAISRLSLVCNGT